MRKGIDMNYQKYKLVIRLVAVPVAVAIIVGWATTGDAFEEVYTTFFGVAIKGYDTVAYHTQGLAKKGFAQYSHDWNDAKWYFASANNRDLFAADPERYAPQYGGY